ncbi:MAG: hypothetical protein JWR34_4044 [Mycobacterium sp.]|jgi:hypothetical protein|nr:hypothetical protein [Mycobacterium sp.]
MDEASEATGDVTQRETPGQDEGHTGGDTGSVVIDCDDCAVRGHGCKDCVVSVLLGVPETLQDDERRALDVLADVGLAPRLRLVPIHRGRQSGVA